MDDTIAQNAVKITRHTHSTSCKCNGSVKEYNYGEWNGDGYYGQTHYFRCSNCSYSGNYSFRCDAYWDADNVLHWGDPVYSGTYPIPSSCPNYSCGKEPGISIEQLTINGTTYNITDGTITEE